jgi:hypothetical protein
MNAEQLATALQLEIREEFPKCDNCDARVLAIVGNGDLDWVHVDGFYACQSGAFNPDGNVAKFTSKVAAQ